MRILRIFMIFFSGYQIAQHYNFTFQYAKSMNSNCNQFLLQGVPVNFKGIIIHNYTYT